MNGRVGKKGMQGVSANKRATGLVLLLFGCDQAVDGGTRKEGGRVLRGSLKMPSSRVATASSFSQKHCSEGLWGH